MTDTKSHPKPESGFSRRVVIWVVFLLAVYLAYSATHFSGRPDAVADFLAMVARRLPIMVVQILPSAVFAGALNGCAIFSADSAGWQRRHWILLAMLAMVAYALPSLLIPILTTGDDWPLPSALVDSARSA